LGELFNAIVSHSDGLLSIYNGLHFISIRYSCKGRFSVVGQNKRRAFAASEDGYEGLLKDKKMLVITARGDSFLDSPLDFQEPFLRAVFDFIGITDITFIHAENLAAGTESRQQSLTAARTAIQQLIATWREQKFTLQD
jgi:hypothetical protein